MDQPVKILQPKPTSKLKLKLLPPIEQEKVTQADIIKFYTDLIKVIHYES